ncbi:MAG: DNA polymerase III subunit alpha [Candidatus Tectomicrobia bacterium]|nr:DNA polymerase III subunit alpha [Candidatus Tectomicrobia bacterium]
MPTSAAPGDFVHLHLHTEYSLLDGANRISALMERAAQFGMPAIGLTDHGNMYGALKFYRAARAAGLKPILGCEAYVAPGSRHDRNPAPDQRAHHLTLLATTTAGYRNLLRLVSAAHLEGYYYRPRLDKELLSAHADGLMALSGCLNAEIPKLLLSDEEEKARQVAAWYRDILGPGNFYLELQNQGIPEQQRVNTGLLKLHRDLALPLVATNDAHYLERGDARAHDVLLCIGTGKTVNDPNRLRYHGEEFYFKDGREMAQVFADYPEALRATMEIAERCELDLPLGQYLLPSYKVPDGRSLDAYLADLARQGLAARMPTIRAQLSGAAAGNGGGQAFDERPYWERLERELDIIRQTGYSGYFLIVWDFIDYARRQGIPVGPGRGSAAGSLAAYALRITALDPLRYHLLFERFLNPERVSLPDIDIDFCMERREEMITYVIEKYGRENVAQIITFGTLQAKASIRDVGRVLDMPYGEVDRIAKLVPAGPKVSLAKALEEERKLRELAQQEGRVADLLATAQRLEGVARNASTHAAGVVISPRPLCEDVPLARGVNGEQLTQYDMVDIEHLGLLKMDFLGLRTLTVIHNAVAMVRDSLGVTFDIEALPLDDAATYRLLCEVRTLGVFQLESRGMRDLVRKLQPEHFEDIIALVALFRPGPLGSGMVDDFIKRRHGLVTVAYELPALEAILRETYGVIVYQEQVMQIASRLAGFSLGEADLLRRAMGKKKPEEMTRQRAKFLDGCRANGIPAAKAEKIFDLMEHFAGYGFNKSHSAAYALLAYQTAYLKAHYPLPFMAALLSSDMGDSDAVMKYLAECRDLGLSVLPPDVNASTASFTAEGERLRFGLSAVKNVGQGAIEAILAARAHEGPFASLYDFLERVDHRQLNKRVVESLVKAGALDSLPGSRAAKLASLESAMEAAQQAQRERLSGQMGLFGVEAQRALRSVERQPEVAEWDETRSLAAEKEVLGFYLSGHPVRRFERLLKRSTNATSRTLAEHANGAQVSCGGLVQRVRSLTTKRGEPMAVVTLEDLVGSLEVVVFPEAYRACAELLVEESPILVRGTADVDGDAAKIIAERVAALTETQQSVASAMHLNLLAPGLREENLAALRQLLQRYRGNRRLLLHLRFPGLGRVCVGAGRRYMVELTEAFIDEVEALFGAEAISFT